MVEVKSLLAIQRRPLSGRELSPRTPFAHQDVPLVVFWSEKAACTTVAKWFFFQAGLLDEALKYHNWVHEYENQVFKARSSYVDECLRAIAAGKPAIKFVRNPYTRAYSGYLETCNRRVMHDTSHWSSQVRRRVLAYLGADPDEPEFTYSFNEFAHWLADVGPENEDPHLAPQFAQIEARLAVHTVRLEDHANPFARIEADLGMPDSSGERRIFSSGHHHAKQACDTPTAIASFNRGIPLQRRPEFRIPDAGPGAIAASRAGPAIRKAFSMDFSAYGYD